MEPERGRCDPIGEKALKENKGTAANAIVAFAAVPFCYGATRREGGMTPYARGEQVG